MYMTLIVTLITDDVFPIASAAECPILPSANAVVKVFPLWKFVL
jgi:hypothetical protein